MKKEAQIYGTRYVDGQYKVIITFEMSPIYENSFERQRFMDEIYCTGPYVDDIFFAIGEDKAIIIVGCYHPEQNTKPTDQDCENWIEEILSCNFKDQKVIECSYTTSEVMVMGKLIATTERHLKRYNLKK